MYFSFKYKIFFGEKKLGSAIYLVTTSNFTRSKFVFFIRSKKLQKKLQDPI